MSVDGLPAGDGSQEDPWGNKDRYQGSDGLGGDSQLLYHLGKRRRDGGEPDHADHSDGEDDLEIVIPIDRPPLLIPAVVCHPLLFVPPPLSILARLIQRYRATTCVQAAN